MGVDDFLDVGILRVRFVEVAADLFEFFFHRCDDALVFFVAVLVLHFVRIVFQVVKLPGQRGVAIVSIRVPISLSRHSHFFRLANSQFSIFSMAFFISLSILSISSFSAWLISTVNV